MSTAGVVKAWLAGQRNRLKWIEFDDYARHVFAGNPANWSSSAVTFTGGINQALGVVSTDVISVDLSTPFAAAAAAAPGDPVAFANSRMDDNAARAFIDDVIKALSHRYGGAKDLVLKLPTPRDLLLACGATASDADDFDNLDDLSLSLCNLLRSFAERNLSGLLLTSGAAAGLSAEETDAYGPMFAAARHYGWVSALAMARDTTDELPAIDCDLFLFPGLTAAALGAAADPRVGGGLSDGFWRAVDGLEPGRERFVFYGTIPADAQPETVVERIKLLQSA